MNIKKKIRLQAAKLAGKATKKLVVHGIKRLLINQEKKNVSAFAAKRRKR